MKTNLKFFKKSKSLAVDKFFQNVLYDKKIGYYTSRQPFGEKGDFLTAPKISILFCSNNFFVIGELELVSARIFEKHFESFKESTT